MFDIYGRLRLSEGEYESVKKLLVILQNHGYIQIIEPSDTRRFLESRTMFKPALYYEDYLKSEEWQALKRRAFAYHGAGCQICGATEGLQVHHLTYEKGVLADPEDLAILCPHCHKKVHAIVDSFQKQAREEMIEKEIPWGLRMAELINNSFPQGIPGWLKQKAVSIIRNTYLFQSPGVGRPTPNYQSIIQKVKKQ